jgi:hypothetical protein
MEGVALPGVEGTPVEALAELMSSQQEALAYWSDHQPPYRWKKMPKEQPQVLLGGMRPELNHITICAKRENH